MRVPKSTEQKDAQGFGSGSQKPPHPEDPMHMQAASVTGDQRVMLECLIEEFARMGWDEHQIARHRPRTKNNPGALLVEFAQGAGGGHFLNCVVGL